MDVTEKVNRARQILKELDNLLASILPEDVPNNDAPAAFDVRGHMKDLAHGFTKSGDTEPHRGDE